MIDVSSRLFIAIVLSLSTLVLTSETEGTCQTVFYRKISDGNAALHFENVISSYSENSVVDCSLRCLRNTVCTGFSYRLRNDEHMKNCQLSGYLSELLTGDDAVGEWSYYSIVDEPKHNSAAPTDSTNEQVTEPPKITTEENFYNNQNSKKR
ncbi:uncharacterized protein LOC114525590 [Dendronephthya gigantea]|uniref:uncharacterized protein LOC114525590 n=1 Tax=Dendronephthya gigantea TaxID=151771 RepID=UPI001069310B|nr:uncharacterized protein LOC114525590 [Dendronephthya gigantea]